MDTILTDREQLAIAACIDYAENHSGAGLPGHSLMILVAKLAVSVAIDIESLASEQTSIAIRLEAHEREVEMLSERLLTLELLLERYEACCGQ